MSSAALKKIIPLLDRVLVKKIKPIEKTAAGIFIPEKAQESLNRGVVIGVGPGSKDIEMTLKEGDKVILPGFGGTNVKNGDEEMLIYRMDEILAKYQE